jgi:hypothetical protein
MDGFQQISFVGDVLWVIGVTIFWVSVFLPKAIKDDVVTWAMKAGIGGYLVSVICRMLIPEYPGQVVSTITDWVTPLLLVLFFILLWQIPKWITKRVAKRNTFAINICKASSVLPFLVFLVGVISRATFFWRF